MYKQLNVAPVLSYGLGHIILYLCLLLMGLRGGCGVGWVSVDRRMLRRQSSFGIVVFGNSGELGT